MSALERWLDDRYPAPPAELERELRAALATVQRSDRGIVDALTDAARERLTLARSRAGRVRESAFDLLAADALFSYACEAALESQNREALLLRIVETAAAP